MIKSTAIRYKDKTHTGRDHSEIFTRMNREKIFTGGKFVEGFVDGYGDFLNRKRAVDEAFKCKQIPAKKPQLFTSDLKL